MSDKDISDYPQKLAQSKFYTSLISAIKKYFNKTLRIEYSDNMLDFILIDEFGCRVMFAELSDGEQSLLSMIFTMYGYDLRQGLLMIDEPEIHFHPQMQRSFSRMMEKMSQSMDTQFIISTYSPLFINELNI
jgi:predicted ATP-dependent endonuclease of OLD family